MAQKPMVHKILILADDDRLLLTRAFPNCRIVGGMKSQVENVGRLMALAANPPRKCGRELRVNEEVHAGCNIA